jgi:hypothetical protein
MTKIVSIVVVAVVSLLFVAAAATGLYLYPFVGVRQ